MYNSRLSQHKSSCYLWFQCWRNNFAVVSQTEWFYFWRTIRKTLYSRLGSPERSHLGFVPDKSSSADGQKWSVHILGTLGEAGGLPGGPWLWGGQFAVLCVAVYSFCPANGFVCQWDGNCLSTPEPSAPSHQHWRSSSTFTPNSTWRSLPMVTDGRCPAPAIPGREMTAALGKEELSGFISPLLAADLLLYSF